MRRINEDDSGNIVRKSTRVDLNDKASERVSHQNVRGLDIGVFEKDFQLLSDTSASAWSRTCFAPPISGSVVGADPRERCDLTCN